MGTTDRLTAHRSRIFLWVAAWIVAIAIAALLDRSIAMRARAGGVEAFLRAESNDYFRETLKAPGEFWFTLLVIAFVGWTHPARWRAAVFVALVVAMTSANTIFKWTVGRRRPFVLDEAQTLAPFNFEPFIDGFYGFFYARNLCFPSGHTAVAFATASALAMLWTRPRWLSVAMFAVAALVAVERVLENGHWLSDCFAGAALGVGSAHLVRALLGTRLTASNAAMSASARLGPLEFVDRR